MIDRLNHVHISCQLSSSQLKIATLLPIVWERNLFSVSCRGLKDHNLALPGTRCLLEVTDCKDETNDKGRT